MYYIVNVEENKGLSALRNWTMARVAIGRTGRSETTSSSLAFKMAHAHARDAVYATMNEEQLIESIKYFHPDVLSVKSKATNRQVYLQRPDLGRQPDETSVQLLKGYSDLKGPDIVFVVADGLSALAIDLHAAPLLKVIIPDLKSLGYSIGPVVVAQQGRVAIGDSIAHYLEAKMVIVFIGERPGLSAADSMGAYLTFHPVPGTTDEARNCISNIRTEGLSYQVAAAKLMFLIQESFRRGLSGVQLKDESDLTLIAE